MTAKKEVEENTEQKTVHAPGAFRGWRAAEVPHLPGTSAEKALKKTV
jgi:hypothetical protein